VHLRGGGPSEGAPGSQVQPPAEPDPSPLSPMSPMSPMSPGSPSNSYEARGGPGDAAPLSFSLRTSPVLVIAGPSISNLNSEPMDLEHPPFRFQTTRLGTALPLIPSTKVLRVSIPPDPSPRFPLFSENHFQRYTDLMCHRRNPHSNASSTTHFLKKGTRALMN